MRTLKRASRRGIYRYCERKINNKSAIRYADFGLTTYIIPTNIHIFFV